MKTTILLEGPLFTQSGYGIHARTVFEALKTRDDVQLLVEPTNWGHSNRIPYEEPLHQEMFEMVKESVKLLNGGLRPDTHVYVGIPPEFKPKAQRTILVSAAMETDRVHENWFKMHNSGAYDKLIVPSEHSKKT